MAMLRRNLKWEESNNGFSVFLGKEMSMLNMVPVVGDKDILEQIKKRVQEIRSYQPRVGVFGGSGVGKSSLCNALFGREMAKISDVKAGTRNPQEITIGAEGVNGGIILIDVPGIGEDLEHHKEYTDLYTSLAPTLDLVLWAIKADDRGYASSLDTYNKVSQTEGSPPVLFVITQVDKTNPIRDWNVKERKPGEAQIKNILEKESDVSTRFNVSTKEIISVSSEEKYNLKELIDLIVEVLPNEKKFSVTREAKEENVTEEAREKAEKGVWDAVKEFAGEVWDSIKDKAVDVLIASAPVIAKKVWERLKGWFS